VTCGIVRAMVDLRPHISDFLLAARLAHHELALTDIELIELRAPHKPPSSLPMGRSAVYIFFHGARCLKVGRAGGKSAPRYCSQHYGHHAKSTVAKSLVSRQAQLGLQGLTYETIKEWMCENTERANLLLPATKGPFVLALLEAFMQCRLNPEFEGFASQRVITQDRADSLPCATRDTPFDLAAISP
jgi:hypothetical protein